MQSAFVRGLRQTVEGLQQATRQWGILRRALPTLIVSPIAQSCDQVFLASIEAPPFGASYIAPMAVLNALLVACANHRRSRTLSLLRAADKRRKARLALVPDVICMEICCCTFSLRFPYRSKVSRPRITSQTFRFGRGHCRATNVAYARTTLRLRCRFIAVDSAANSPSGTGYKTCR